MTTLKTLEPVGWIGVDLDGTLAKYDNWESETHIGEPVPLMLNRVRKWIAMGIEIRIVTARAERPGAVLAIEGWCRLHLGKTLLVTNKKDFGMLELWDDRCVAVEENTGKQLNVSRMGLE